MELNKEQLKAIRHKGGPLLVIAGAGTGKTTVITERVKYLIEKGLAKPEEILALTFTEKASREMEERIDVALPYGYTNMWVLTFHSFCERILRREGLHIGLDPRYRLMTQAENVQLIRSNLFKFKLTYFRPLGNPYKFIDGLIAHFARLQDENISPHDYVVWVQKQNKKIEEKEKEKWQELTNAYRTYEELKVKEGVMDFGDLIVKTIKLFEDRPNILKEYQKQFKYILIDEFQDTNYAQNELALLLSKKNKNITVVGDDDQCLPPNAKISTLNGDKKIKDIKVGDEVLTAVGKGHTSASCVSRILKNIKTTRFLTFETESGKKIEVTDNHKMFCFLPAHYEVKGVYFVYIMYHTRFGWRVGVTRSLPQRLRLEHHADKIIGIGSYTIEEEARFYEAYYSAKYGIPTVAFTPRPGQAIAGELLNRLFREIDTRANVSKLADDLRIELDSPQFMVGAITRGEARRVKINFEMCARNYIGKSSKDGFLGNPIVLHRVHLETSNPGILSKLRKARISLTKAKKGMRVRREFAEINEAWDFAKKLEVITNGIIDKRFKVGRFNYQYLSTRIVPASHVFVGMYLPVLEGKEVVYEKVIARKEEDRKSTVYDLEIEKTHNFIANGIVVHNSIYRFRGAAVSNIIQFRRNFPETKIVVLTRNYRSTQEILDCAYKLIQHNNPDRLEVVEKVNKKLISQRSPTTRLASRGDPVIFIHEGRVESEADEVAKEIKKLSKKYDYKDFAILVRANNHSEPFLRALARYGIPYQFLGPSRLFRQSEIVDLISYLRVLYNYEDSSSFYRVMSMDQFNINPRDIASIGNYARKYNLSLFEAAEKSKSEKVTKLTKIINKHLGLIKKETAGQILYYFLEDSGILTNLIDPKSVDGERRANNISKFFDKLKTYEVDHPNSDIFSVVDYLNLSMEVGESPLAADTDWTEVNTVNILTVHGAKGLEFPIVFLVNLVSQRFPTIERHEQIPIPEALIKEILSKGDYHLQEERRLFYVGMTRAKNKLYLTAANYYGEGKRDKKLSPFISEALGEKSHYAFASRDKQNNFLDYKQEAEPAKVYRLENKLHIDYLSYSQIDTFRVCPLHYKLKYILGLPSKPSASQSFGISIHNTLKDFYSYIRENPTSHRASRDKIQKLLFEVLKDNWEHEGFTSKSHEEKLFKEATKYLSGYLQSEFNIKRLPVAMELPFTLPIARNLKLVGTIDRVDLLPSGKIEIWDYKTGANVPTQKEVDHNLQLSIYALAATILKEKPFGGKPEEIKLTLYYFDGQKKITTTRSRSDLEKAKEEILALRDEMEKSDFKCSGSFLCKICEFKSLCSVEE